MNKSYLLEEVVALKIFNTMTRRVDELIPGGVKKNEVNDYPAVTIYSCGPTVYSYAHIGNFRAFIFNDLLRRYRDGVNFHAQGFHDRIAYCGSRAA